MHDVGCHVIHNACCEAGLKSQRECVVAALATEKLTEPQGLTWMHGDTRDYRGALTSQLLTQRLFTTPRS